MPQINLPMTTIAGFCFNLGCLIAIDMTHYTGDAQDFHAHQKRSITLTLVGPTLHTFKGAQADEIYDWYLGLTGQKTMELVSFPERDRGHA